MSPGFEGDEGSAPGALPVSAGGAGVAGEAGAGGVDWLGDDALLPGCSDPELVPEPPPPRLHPTAATAIRHSMISVFTELTFCFIVVPFN